ncbi:anthrone oxygenase family protein [uncultured Flavobacterium sp.]|uniref:anthrone oxygenase family protein n=1 Tax=uncultured Flavobacterium sp. TaxID=165435 RepID=UPI002931ECD7|nr:anthrone oxygenase family protein [uncultured Flavobacterium sp.]
MSLSNIILGITILATALIAGLYYGYSCSVTIGLNKLSSKEYILAMQSINVAIQNPWFFASFMGTLFLLPISAYLNFTSIQSPRFLLLLAAAVIYTIGSFGVTVFGNVPLNDMLANVDLKTATSDEMNMARQNFENPWNTLHNIRTIATIVSLIFCIIASINTSSES